MLGLFSGLLEQPSLPSGVTPAIFSFKVLLMGKSGVGKTSTVAKLAGKGDLTIFLATVIHVSYPHVRLSG